MITAVLIGAGQRGTYAYCEYGLEHKDELKIIAVAEPIRERREYFAKRHDISADMVFDDWEKLLEKGKIADCAMVCTQDKFHTAPVKKALSLGYHVMCEKPMSPDSQECIEMAEYSKKYGKTLTVCHVLRYSPFYTELKKILDSRIIGDIVSVQHIECVGYWHQAHSFVRGNWRNSTETSPMILAKSCHDMDILTWLIGKKCKKVSSFGSLMHFKPENAPQGAGKRCLIDCKAQENCPYDVKKIYFGNEWYTDLIRGIVARDKTDDAVIAALQTGPYGRCVYHCDNDVVDHQVVNLEYENGTTVSFTMCAFTFEGSRVMNIMGTMGQILCDMEKNEIVVKEFLTGNTNTLNIKTPIGGHSGSDDRFMKGFIKTVESDGEFSLSGAEESLESHLIALAAEESRLTGKTISMDEIRHKI
ncbi:MAG: Gfo/Idh/MocA family oxidoreductase [Spirochaetales bacterium]